MEKISISVILPCYNVEKYIEQALLSLKKQTLSAIEIIAVDDGSQDNTWEIIKNYPDIISIHKVNGGYGSAINLGLSIAKMCIRDSDWTPSRSSLKGKSSVWPGCARRRGISMLSWVNMKIS